MVIVNILLVKDLLTTIPHFTCIDAVDETQLFVTGLTYAVVEHFGEPPNTVLVPSVFGSEYTYGHDLLIYLLFIIIIIFTGYLYV
jgi:hypothetical protein